MAVGNAYNVYKNNSVNFASKEQLLLMLVDGSVKFVKIARQAILDRDIQKAHDNLIKTQDIFTELIISLDAAQAGGWGEDLLKIYNFIKSELVRANIKKDLTIVDSIIPLIEDVRDTWNEAYKLSKKE